MSQEPAFRYAYIVSDQKDGQILSDKLKSLAKQLSCSVMPIYIDNKFYAFLAFKNEIDKQFIFEHIQSLHIQENQFVPIISQDLQNPTDNFTRPFYITNFPPSFDTLLNDIWRKAQSEYFKTQFIKKVTISDEDAGRFISIFLPHIEFPGGIHINITTDPLKVPGIIVSNLPPDFRIKELSLFKYPFKILKSEFTSDVEENSPRTAYLLFSNNEEAFKAIEYFNFAKIDQYDIEAIHFLDKELKQLKQWEITVRKISSESRPFDVWDRFKPYGQLIQTKIVENTNSGLIYATVQFLHKTDAENAIKDIQSSGSSLVLGFTNEFIVTIYNIDPSLKQQDIAQQFKQVSDVEIISPDPTSASYAIITFQTPTNAELCLNSETVVNGLLWCIRKGPIDLHQKAEIKKLFKQYKTSNTIKVSNLPAKFSLDEFINLCSEFGVSRYINIVQSTGIVSYTTKEMAEEASKVWKEKGINGHQVTIEEIF